MPSLPPGHRLYLRLNGKVAGPYAWDMLESLRDQGMLLAMHEVSVDGEVWTSAAEAGLFSGADAAPAPPGSPSPSSDFDDLDGPSREVEDDSPRRRRRHRAAAPGVKMPAWLMLVLAGVLGLVTSLGAYFLAIRPLLARPKGDSEKHVTPPPTPPPEGSGGKGNERPSPPGPGPGKATFGWLLPRVTPKRPLVDQELEVTVEPSLKGPHLPYDHLAFTLAGEKQVPTFDRRRKVFRFKAPPVAMGMCKLLVQLPPTDDYRGSTGEVTFEVGRLPRGPLELSAGPGPLPRGKVPVVALKWGAKAAMPPEGTEPVFSVDGRDVPPEQVKGLGEDRYGLEYDLPVGPHKVEARFAADDRYEVTRATAALTVVANKVTVRLALPAARYVPRQGARLGVTVEGEGGAKLTGDVALYRRGADRPLARATLKDGVAQFDVKELSGNRVDLEARYLGDGKAHDPAAVVEKGLAVVQAASYSALAWPDRSPNETEDFTIPKAARTGSEALASAGLDPKKAYHLRLVFPADEKDRESTRHTFTAPTAPGGLTVSWAASYTPQLKVLKEQAPNLLRFVLEGKDGAVLLRHELDEAAVARELTFEKALYAEDRFRRKDKLAAIRRRLEALRLLRAKGVIEVHAEAPKGPAAVPLLVIRLDGEKRE